MYQNIQIISNDIAFLLSSRNEFAMIHYLLWLRFQFRRAISCHSRLLQEVHSALNAKVFGSLLVALYVVRLVRVRSNNLLGTSSFVPQKCPTIFNYRMLLKKFSWQSTRDRLSCLLLSTYNINMEYIYYVASKKRD